MIEYIVGEVGFVLDDKINVMPNTLIRDNKIYLENKKIEINDSMIKELIEQGYVSKLNKTSKVQSSKFNVGQLVEMVSANGKSIQNNAVFTRNGVIRKKEYNNKDKQWEYVVCGVGQNIGFDTSYIKSSIAYTTSPDSMVREEDLKATKEVSFFVKADYGTDGIIITIKE